MSRLVFAALLLLTPGLYAQAPQGLKLPSQTLDSGIIATNDISYVKDPVDSDKQSLDVYRKEGIRKAPVLVFVHGGAWVRGDRKQYPFLGNRFAREGYVVVVPSYRLSPKVIHPAHVQDVAAAVAWTIGNIESYGGDPNRVVIAGHSAGGHLVSLLATDPSWLKPYDLTPSRLRGVIALSGVYDFTGLAGRSSSNIFGREPEQLRAASPRSYVNPATPPFLITYCEFDYATLPEQAKDFHQSLLNAKRPSTLVYIQGESHVSEILSIVKEGDATVCAMLQFLDQVLHQ